MEKVVDADLDERLARMTLLVRNFALGFVRARDFEAQYSDFYYYEALDGHEASSALLPGDQNRLSYAVELHRRIQIDVVDRLAIDSGFSTEDMIVAGRLTENDAMEAALKICTDIGVQALIAGCNK